MSTVQPIMVGFHAGNIIHYLSQNYGDGFSVLREAIQNALDKHAKNIFARIDCPKGIIQVFDDGDGAGHTEIYKKFDGIGLSLKLDDPDASGEKGIGNLAGLAVAREWQLLTRDKEVVTDPYRLYSFERAELKKRNAIQVNCETTTMKSIPGAPFVARTMLRLLDVDELTLRQLGNSDVISRTLTDAFGNKLRARKVELRISYVDPKGKSRDFLVRPPQFRGAPMNPDEIDTEYGVVEFVFYHSPSPVQSPSILVQHKGVTGIPLGNFFKMKILGKEIEDLFARGYFEGEIKLGFCEINPMRSAFVQNHQLKVFVQTIESFAMDALRPLVEQLDQAGRQERHKRIADALLKRVRGYFKKYPSFLPPTMKSLIFQPGAGENGSGTDAGTSGPGSGVKPELKKKKPSVLKPLDPDAFKKQRAKSRAAVPTGSKKQESHVLVIEDGIGLEMYYPKANEEGILWHSRTKDGVIQVNAANNEFLDAERRGQTKLSEYMFLLLQKELTCASLNPMEARGFGTAFEKSFMTFWRASLD